MKKFYALICVVSLIGFSSACSNEVFSDSTVGNSDAFSPEVLSGQEIFNGIYFLSGSVAGELTTLEADRVTEVFAAFTPEQIQEFAEFKSAILNSIEMNNPGFFDMFKTEMTSGDHFRIKRAMDASFFEYQKAFLSIPGVSSIYKEMQGADIQYEDFVDTDGNFDGNRFESRLMELFGGSTISFDNQGKCIVAGIVILVAGAVVAYYAAAVAGVVGVVGGFYLALVAGQYVEIGVEDAKINKLGTSIEEMSLKVEVFIDEVSTTLYVSS